MAYYIRPHHDLANELKRLMQAQLENAISILHRPDLNDDKKIHEVRKACKEWRAAIRLLRPGLKNKEYLIANRTVRDAARLISSQRDETVMQELHEEITRHLSKNQDTSWLEILKDQLFKATTTQESPQFAFHQIATALQELHHTLDFWDFSKIRRKDLIAGLIRLYEKGSREMPRALSSRDAHLLHEWRKRVKYTRYQLFILHRYCPPLLLAQRDAAKHLSEMLGRHHDLHVYRLHINRALCTDSAVVEPTQAQLLPWLEREMQRLENEIKELGTAFYAEPSELLALRLEAYFRSQN